MASFHIHNKLEEGLKLGINNSYDWQAGAITDGRGYAIHPLYCQW